MEISRPFSMTFVKKSPTKILIFTLFCGIKANLKKKKKALQHF